MNPIEQESILTLALMAAFADGAKHDAERAELKRIDESLPQDAVQLAALYQRVLLRQVTVAQAAGSLPSPELRQLAYEMAVCVGDADGAQTAAEQTFLSELRRELHIEAAPAAAFERSADALAVEPLADASVPPVIAAASAVDAQVDKMVLNYAILNGALELLPESLATMAIVPLQMKMVYRVGKSYGHELGRGHIKESLAAAVWPGARANKSPVRRCCLRPLGRWANWRNNTMRAGGNFRPSNCDSFSARLRSRRAPCIRATPVTSNKKPAR